MAAPVRVGPPRVTIARGDRILVCALDAGIDGDRAQGFLAADTRLLSGWRLTLGGKPPRLVASRSVEPWSARFELSNDRLDDAAGPLEPGALRLRIDRTIAGGVHEDLDLVSDAPRPVEVELSIATSSDFADLFEVRAGRRNPRGRVTASWSARSGTLRRRYANGPFRRGLDVAIRRATSPPVRAGDEITFVVALEPAGRWHACLLWLPVPGGRPRLVPGCSEVDGATALPRVTLHTGDPDIDRPWEAAIRDLEALRLEDASAPGLAVPAAGIPWYAALFGRDSLIASALAIAAFPEYAAGSLQRLAALQATADDPARDMEPGKIPHEIRHGELAELGLLPFHPYYGTHDASSLFVSLLADTVAWTADVGLARRLLPYAERAMGWIDRHGDRDGDGLQEYAPRATGGFPHQGWKDSRDGIPTASGGEPDPPIALVELQGYAYAAKLRLAGLLDLSRREDDAARLRGEAAALRDRVNADFWWEAEGTYVLALDGRKQPIESVASNAGHLLASGIVPADRAPRLAARLLAPDMWSGWGVRTLSAAHPAYDPFSYHRGSVWPHDNAIIALGCRRYGLDAAAAGIARGLLEAAACFEGFQLPELFAGVPRGETTVPVPYPDACVPQAWAAAAVVALVLSFAGLSVEPAASGPGPAERVAGRLHVRPALPDWLPRMTIAGLRAGTGRLDLRLSRGAVEVLANSTGFEILSP